MPKKVKSVLLVVTGSIAAVKVYDLIRLLIEKKIAVTCVLTKAAEQFVTPMACSALSGTKTYTDLFSLTDELEMGHIELSRANDVVLVAPASADLMGKLANGLADDLASTLLLATDKPVYIAPAMNVRMWAHAAVQRNIKTLQKDGVTFIGPVKGAMACGEFGMGRMAEPVDIVKALV